VAVTTAERRGRLEDARDLTKTTKRTLRDQLRDLEKSARLAIAGGSLSQVSANGRNSQFSFYGPGQITPAEVCILYRDLIDRFDDGLQWITFCAKYGFDAYDQLFQGAPTPPPAPVPNPVLIDSEGKWALLAAQFSIDPASIVGAKVSDDAVFLWMMDHLFAVTEARSNFESLRMGATGLQII
jgi:hypothetical protein